MGVPWIIAGIDLSLRNTGIVLIDITGQFRESFIIMTNKDNSWIETVHFITSAIEEYIDRADKVYLENYAFGATHGREKVAEVGGIVKKMVFDRKGELPVVISPRQARLFALGRGSAPPCPEDEVKSTWSKKWLKEEVKRLYDMDFKTDHEADAFVVATIGRFIEAGKAGLLDETCLPSHQQKVLSKILKEEVSYGKDATESGGLKQSGKRGRGNSKKSTGE